MTQLVLGPGSRLAASDTECRLSVCNTLTNLLSHDIYRKSLIVGNLVRSLLSMAYPHPPKSLQVDPELDEDPQGEANLLLCRQEGLKALYSICAMPDFAKAYPLSTELVKDCLASVREPHLVDTQYGAIYDGELLPMSAACVILASLTQSEHIARALVAEHKIHERLSDLLRSIDDQDVLYPAINFIGRLALPAQNKTTLFECGLLGAMCRFLELDTAPNVQREAVIAVRRLVTGSPQALAFIQTNNPFRSIDLVTKDSELAAALALFRRTDDGALRLEIGRLAVEVCRILWAFADGKPEEAEEHFNTTVGPCRQAFADAVAFVILHGEDPGARGEGWFGFAMMCIWSAGRDLINNCLSGEDMLAEVKKVVASGGGPAYQNLRVVLAKMNALPVRVSHPSSKDIRFASSDLFVQKNAVFPETQTALESAAENMGLARIWST